MAKVQWNPPMKRKGSMTTYVSKCAHFEIRRCSDTEFTLDVEGDGHATYDTLADAQADAQRIADESHAPKPANMRVARHWVQTAEESVEHWMGRGWKTLGRELQHGLVCAELVAIFAAQNERNRDGETMALACEIAMGEHD